MLTAGNELRHALNRGTQMLLAFAVLAGFASSSFAQFAGGGFGGGGGGGGGFGGGGFGGGGFGGGGIAIDAKGVITPKFQKENSVRLDRKRREAFSKKFLSADLNLASPLRKVSLVRLEKAAQQYADRKEHVPPEMQYLAGLQRIDYVFVYPETNDVVIAGPAEGFAPNAVGRVVGTSTGRPPLKLDDLIVALRSVPRGSVIGCSIDPTEEGVARFNTFVKRNSSPATPAVIQRRFRAMSEAMGMQKVSVFGVPHGTQFARLLVEADYRMKMISMGIERVRLKGFKSHLEMIGGGQNTLQRWWFTPLYDAFQQSRDGNAFQFSGQRVQLMSQEEKADAAGRRSAAAFTSVSIQRFSKQFTKRFNEVAAVSPVFAELQNVFDLAILAALLQKEAIPQKIGWRQELFLDPERAPLATGSFPREVKSVTNSRRAGRLIVGLVGGGVEIRPGELLAKATFNREGNRELESTFRLSAAKPNDDGKIVWWWD